MYENWVKMTKDGEEKLVHPGNVNNHLRFGWELVEKEPAPVEPKTEEDLPPWMRLDAGAETKPAEEVAESTAVEEPPKQRKAREKAEAKARAEQSTTEEVNTSSDGNNNQPAETEGETPPTEDEAKG